MATSRRKFLTTTAVGSAMAGFGDLGFLAKLPSVSAAEQKSNDVRFRPEIEPIVQLLENSPRATVLEAVAERIRQGTSYREILTALLLAGVRNIQPRPAVGFKFHAVLVVNSAHLASISAPDSDRWLPILWAIDEFKASQAADIKEGDWTMGRVDESAVPAPHKAEQAFVDAMDRWDVAAVDAATAGLARSMGANRVFDLFAKYGMRDFRSIGHKAIYVANSWRTLQCIGWQHAEPVLRSLAYALVNHNGEPNPADNDLKPDRPWRRNVELAKTIRSDWKNAGVDPDASRSIMNELHDADEQSGPKLIAEMIATRAATRSIYDGLMLSAGELLMRQPGIIGLHAVTTTNALRYMFRTASSDNTRRMILLQNAAFLPMFREAAEGRGKVSDARLLELKIDGSDASADQSAAAVFRDISGDRNAAAQKLLGYLDAGHSAKQFIDHARRLIFLKGTNAHDYKFSSAALEDYYNITPQLRKYYLASSVFNLRGSGDKDNQLVQRIRGALDA
jgi:hypothetical protein